MLILWRSWSFKIPEHLPKDEVIRFCLEIAEENMRRARGEPVEAKTIAEMSAWLRRLVGG